jgi:(p)ppGpp synthase/HD superfamily hydrolase
MIDTNCISHAQEFARFAHESIIETTVSGVKRPKVVHLQEVADLVWASGGSDEEIVAAWLHDSVEDTTVTLELIEKEFGKGVADLVNGLTDFKDMANLPLLERKRKQSIRIKAESNSVRRIKLADQTSNVRFLATDPTKTMTFEECRDYIQGAKLIADECRGVTPLLEKLFDQAYERGSKRYGFS